MKIKTNLSASEIEVVGRGLIALSKSQRSKGLPAENNAEEELLRRTDASLDRMLDSIQLEISSILLE